MVEELFSTENQIVSIILGSIGLILLMSLAFVLIFYLLRKRIIKNELEKANLEIGYQKNLLQSIIITQEEERKRIAQDLHDAISSKLNVVSLNAHLLTENNMTAEESHKIGACIFSMTSNILENSRRIAHDLLPPTLDKFGLTAALEELCEELSETGKFDLDYRLNYTPGLLTPSNELHIFRIVQELMNNSIKHSEASGISLHLKNEENILSFQYQDDGKGFEMDAVKKAKGLGMSGIENRAIILDGELQMASGLGNGLMVNFKTFGKNAD